jgi:adenylate cyclase
LVLVTLAAFLFLMRQARLAFMTGLLLAAGAVVIATFLLRGGLFLPISAALFTLALAWTSRTVLEAWQWRHTQERLRTTFAGRVGPAVLRDILRGRLNPAENAERLELAFVAVGLREPLSASAPSSRPDETLSILRRLQEIIATAVHRHDGFIDTVAADGGVAVFGAPRRLQNPCGSAAAAVTDILRGVGRLNDERAKEGKPPLDLAMAATFGEAVAGKVAAFGTLHYAVTGAAADEAIRLRDEARRVGQHFLASAAFRSCAGEALSDFQHSGCD